MVAHGWLGLAGDNTPYVPSTPVQIGTPGAHHGVAEAGAWQALIVMLVVVIVVGAAVLLYAVRQRARLLERRRVRRMAQAEAALAETAAQGPRVTDATPIPHLVHAPHPLRLAPATARTTPATPGRPAPNA